jgi:ribosomal protein L37AE/L43A
MQRYTCPKCGAASYSSAMTSTVGACPRCSESLAGTKADIPGRSLHVVRRRTRGAVSRPS